MNNMKVDTLPALLIYIGEIVGMTSEIGAETTYSSRYKSWPRTEALTGLLFLSVRPARFRHGAFGQRLQNHQPATDDTSTAVGSAGVDIYLLILPASSRREPSAGHSRFSAHRQLAHRRKTSRHYVIYPTVPVVPEVPELMRATAHQCRDTPVPSIHLHWQQQIHVRAGG